MVAQTIRLPNIRKMFVPDLGYTIVDADLAGADAQIVAWEADDTKLKTAFRKGLKIHIVNARDVWPERTQNMTDAEIKETGSAGGMYYQIKRAVHATNYGASDKALIDNLGWTNAQAADFRKRWFSAHPEIEAWHERIANYLDGTQCWNCDNLDISIGKPCEQCGKHLGRTVKNRFGFRRIYFDRVDGALLPQALAWIPQSSVAFAVDIGWTAMAYGTRYTSLLNHQVKSFDWTELLVEPNSYNKWHNIVQFLLQVHDSVVFQVPNGYEEAIPEIVHDLQVRVPYDDPLVIPLSHASSRLSWGDCKE